VVDAIIDGRVFEAYVTALAAITDVCRARAGAALPIAVHGYAHPVPDGRGVLGGWGPLPGPWLQPGFHSKGFHDLDVCLTMVGEIIDRFNAMLQRTAALPGFGHVRYVDVRRDLPSGSNYKRWWANELHPTKRGFQAVAARIARSIEGR
jgi:hypothetical protein